MGKVKYREIGFDSIEDFLKWYPMHDKSWGTMPLPVQKKKVLDTKLKDKKIILLPKKKQADEIVEKIINNKKHEATSAKGWKGESKLVKSWLGKTAPKKRGRKRGSYKVKDKTIVAYLKGIKKQQPLSKISKHLKLSEGSHNSRIKRIAAYFGMQDKIKRFSQ
jgi:hypothetical protein